MKEATEGTADDTFPPNNIPSTDGKWNWTVFSNRKIIDAKMTMPKNNTFLKNVTSVEIADSKHMSLMANSWSATLSITNAITGLETNLPR